MAAEEIVSSVGVVTCAVRYKLDRRLESEVEEKKLRTKGRLSFNHVIRRCRKQFKEGGHLQQHADLIGATVANSVREKPTATDISPTQPVAVAPEAQWFADVDKLLAASVYPVKEVADGAEQWLADNSRQLSTAKPLQTVWDGFDWSSGAIQKDYPPYPFLAHGCRGQVLLSRKRD